MNNTGLKSQLLWVIVFAIINCSQAQAAARPDVSISLRADSGNTAIIGDLVSIAMVSHNHSPTTARQVRATLQLPSNATLLSYSPGCKFLNKRARKRLQLTCKLKRLDPASPESGEEFESGSKKWIVVISADQLGILDIRAKVTTSGRDYKISNNTANIQVTVEKPPIISPEQGTGGFDACGCPSGTLWHPEMNHCMAIGLCDLPEYKGQCQAGDQCIACSKNGIPQRPKPGGICP